MKAKCDTIFDFCFLPDLEPFRGLSECESVNGTLENRKRVYKALYQAIILGVIVRGHLSWGEIVREQLSGGKLSCTLQKHFVVNFTKNLRNIAI